MTDNNECAAWKKWWYEIGSGIYPFPNHDMEERSERISKIAWQAAILSVGIDKNGEQNGR